MQLNIASSIHRAARHTATRLALAFVAALSTLGAVALPVPGTHNSAAASPAVALPQSTSTDPGLFGMVMRDPFYEFNSDPVNFPMASNKTALERQASELAAAGVRWVRMEFFADYDGTVAPGDINWSKYDLFINDIAPRYGLKVLALLNVGMVAYQGQTLRTLSFNDPPDRAGTDPDDGSNNFIRVFTGRAQAIAAHYGTAISAYEIINEPNISWDLWQDSHLGSAEVKPDRYSSLITSAYRAIKNVNAQAQVIVGGLMIGSPPEGQDHDQFDYLYQLYMSPWVQHYRDLGLNTRPGWGYVPWDGVALHPYYLDTPKLFALLKDFSRKLQDRGDARSKLWITEIGMQATPAVHPGDPPTDEEKAQSDYLRSVYGGILADSELMADVAHVFWFKYEDFVPGNYTHNYGLVRLQENATHDNYDPSGTVYVHKLAYETYRELAFGGRPTDPMNKDQAIANNQLYFDATGQAIAPQFSAYWLEKGGLGLFGYPISRPVMINGYLSQFFQRAVFEYHPENEPPNDVLLRLLGSQVTSWREFEKAEPATIPPEKMYFPETGHSLGGAFLNYWQNHGGLAVYGYPISEEISEVSKTDGQLYLVQYFQRNRFEYHPEAAGTDFEVQLGLLGADLLKTNAWWR